MNLVPLTDDPPRAARLLEQSLLVNFVIHAFAMLTMGLFLLPGLPGGGTLEIARRAAYVAHHPWLWRLGWFPWQLSALADLWMGVALLQTKWIPRWPARLTILFTLAAIVPDQSGQFLWITRGVQSAQHAALSTNPAAYLQFESATYRAVAAWGCLGYLMGALGWTWCFAAAGTWNRTLTWLSLATWGVFTFSTVIIFIPQAHRPSPLVAAAGNAIGFVLLQTWFILVIERIARRSRPDQVNGSWLIWKHPATGIVGWCANAIANSRFARLLGEWIGSPALISDIRDVIYVNYLVEAQRLAPLLPWGLELQRLGPGGRYAMFSILTYRHGHFGPRRIGPLRKAVLSPIQSNWRLYVVDPTTGHAGVYFVATAISSTLYALIARLFSEGISMHVLAHSQLGHDPDGTHQITLDPGAGSAPDLRLSLRPDDEPGLPAPFRECFKSYREFLTYCVPQDRALAPQPWYRRIVRQEITLGIPLETCQPLQGEVQSAAAARIVGDATPVCFRIPQVTFRFDRALCDRK